MKDDIIQIRLYIANSILLCLSPLFSMIFPRKLKVRPWFLPYYFLDILNDDYFAGTKMAMKIKHVKGIVSVLRSLVISVEHHC